MFNDITTSYDLSDATWEIVIMLLVAFILGWLLRHIMCCRKSDVDTATQPVENTDTSADTTITPLVSSPDLSQIDDLKIVEGIGPKIESLLHAAGITSMRGLAIAETSTVQKVLDDAGPRFRMHDPKTWSTQAELIADEKWDALKEYQDFLNGGRES